MKVWVGVFFLNTVYSWPKRAPECIIMHYFEGEYAKFFSGEGAQTHPHWGGGYPSPDQTPPPTALSAPPCVDRPDHISRPPNFKS